MDPVCAIHGKCLSEHDCLYCCLCFKHLTPDEYSYLPNGTRTNVCVPCAEAEYALLVKRATANEHYGDPMKAQDKKHDAQVRWISRLDQPHQAQCSCGWHGRTRTYFDEAQQDAMVHNGTPVAYPNAR